MAPQSEAVHKQQDVVRGTSHDSGKLGSENHLEAMKSGRQGDKPKSAQRHVSPGRTGVNKQPTKRKHDTKCSRCSKTPWHNRQQCPAREAQCHKCQKTGHYSCLLLY